jgi:peroxiredoxin
MAYGACQDPKDEYAKRITYVIDPSGRIAQAYPKVSPKSHPKEILDTLGGASGGRT